MKRILVITFVLIMVLGVNYQAESALQDLGIDSLGNQLIYDTDLDITWYDYTNTSNPWQAQVDWASGLSVNFGGSALTGWRLPTTAQPDPSCTSQYDPGGGLPIESTGHYCSGSEMGHLYYTEFGNDLILSNTGIFQNLVSGPFWTGTEIDSVPINAWRFSTFDGNLDGDVKTGYSRAIAVRQGLAVVPEPISSILFVTGGTILGFRRFRKINK